MRFSETRTLMPMDSVRRRRMAWCLAIIALVTVACGPAWIKLLRDATGDALHAYAAAIPFLSAWLVWRHRAESPDPPPRAARTPAVLLGFLAVLSISAGRWAAHAGWIATDTSWLTTQMLGWVLAVWAAVLGTFGMSLFRRHAFALGFLLFTIPLPTPVVNAVEIGLQQSSAWAVDTAFRATGVTFYRSDRAFVLPGLTFVVAQECSGIRSTLVLFIVGVLGGKMILRRPLHRAILALVIPPLGIARNMVRILTITLLSVHVDPRIIDSPLHHQGGPLFFAASLVPFFALLAWLRRRERSTPDQAAEPLPGPPFAHDLSDPTGQGRPSPSVP